MNKYEVISKFFDDGTVAIGVPHVAIHEKSVTFSKSNCDEYIDVFDTKEEAYEFYQIAIEENA